MDKTKLNVGCGDDILDGYVNVDLAKRTGVDVVHDLTRFPWPLPSDHFKEVRVKDILEHLPDTIQTLEEVWRVSVAGAAVDIRVPYWNSRWAWMDPQHIRAFHEQTFDFFDPSKELCKQRPHYSHARLKIDYVVFEGCWFWMGFPFERRVFQNKPSRCVHFLTRLCDTIHFMRFRLTVIK